MLGLLVLVFAIEPLDSVLPDFGDKLKLFIQTRNLLSVVHESSILNLVYGIVHLHLLLDHLLELLLIHSLLWLNIHDLR